MRIVRGVGLSECCGAPPATEIEEGLALCSHCREWAEFEEENEETCDAKEKGLGSDERRSTGVGPAFG